MYPLIYVLYEKKQLSRLTLLHKMRKITLEQRFQAETDNTVKVIFAISQGIVQVDTPVAPILRKANAVILLTRPTMSRGHTAVQSRQVKDFDAQVVTVLLQNGKFRESVSAAAERTVMQALEVLGTAKRKEVGPAESRVCREDSSRHARKTADKIAV